MFACLEPVFYGSRQLQGHPDILTHISEAGSAAGGFLLYLETQCFLLHHQIGWLGFPKFPWGYIA